MSRLKRPSLLVQIAIAAIIGVFIGGVFPEFSKNLKILGTLFITLVQMTIVPLIFPIIVLSIVNVKKNKNLSSLTLKTFGIFFGLTTSVIILSLVLGKITGIGANVDTVNITAKSIEGVASNIKLTEFILALVPKNFFEALAGGNLLPIIFFGIFLGVALTSIGEEGESVILFLESWVKAIYKIVDYVIVVAPLGVLGMIASDVATTGISNLFLLAQFVILLFVGYLIVAVIVFPIISLIYKISYIKLLKNIKDLILIAFATGSSSTVLPVLIERSEKNGIPKSLASFIIPLGYSFNLVGACVYISLAITFITNLYGQAIGWGQILPLALFLTIISKGIAAVPSGALVVLLAAAGQLGLQPEGVALIVAVDFLANAGRTALNVVANGLVPEIVNKIGNSNIKIIESENKIKNKLETIGG